MRGIFGVDTSGGRRALERPEELTKAVDLVVGEPRADVPRPVQPVRLTPAEDERAELRTTTRSAGVADDREVLLRAKLHLLPLGRPSARPVRRVGALGDDPLEPLRLRRGEQRVAVVERGRHADLLDGRVEQLLEEPPSLLERSRVNRLVVDGEQVERHQDQPPGAALERLEAGGAVLVERTDLPVDHRRGRADGPRRRAGDVAEPLGEVGAVAAREGRLSAGDGDDRPVAVPLRLVEPALALREPLGELGELGAKRRCVVGRRVLPEEQPVPLVAVEARRDERPDPLGTLAVETDGEAAAAFLLEELVRPAVPDLDGARPVLPGRDDALERRVVEGVVLDVHREVTLARPEREPFRDGPAREGAVPLEPQVVVEPPGVVALDHEDRRLAGGVAAERLRRLLRVALSPVVAKIRHRPDDPIPRHARRAPQPPPGALPCP